MNATAKQASSSDASAVDEAKLQVNLIYEARP